MVKWLVPLAVLFLVPGINIIAPALWIIFGGWLLALEYLDYPMDNHAIGVREQRRRLAGSRWLAMGFGAGVMLMTTSPCSIFLRCPLVCWARPVCGAANSETPSADSSPSHPGSCCHASLFLELNGGAPLATCISPSITAPSATAIGARRNIPLNLRRCRDFKLVIGPRTAIEPARDQHPLGVDLALAMNPSPSA